MRRSHGSPPLDDFRQLLTSRPARVIVKTMDMRLRKFLAVLFVVAVLFTLPLFTGATGVRAESDEIKVEALVVCRRCVVLHPLGGRLLSRSPRSHRRYLVPSPRRRALHPHGHGGHRRDGQRRIRLLHHPARTDGPLLRGRHPLLGRRLGARRHPLCRHPERRPRRGDRGVFPRPRGDARGRKFHRECDRSARDRLVRLCPSLVSRRLIVLSSLAAFAAREHSLPALRRRDLSRVERGGRRGTVCVFGLGRRRLALLRDLRALPRPDGHNIAKRGVYRHDMLGKRRFVRLGAHARALLRKGG